MLAANGLQLAEVGELELQMFKLAQMYNRNPNAQFSTSAPILANPSYVYNSLNLTSVKQKNIRKNKGRDKAVKPNKLIAFIT